ncbi:ATP-binding protein [aff. Roholtiella sp. LEGE 12411]|uniref:ATP-binding protein n=1 Tax=aff. Roholtiella sp. LEGE 12411 TaxID=1828822 RepID=UPI00187EC28E|nr:ATP-binding protein [aff. Roholtiella sp. LEGE 12411]MBE9039026.1 ATP-binding protein [aff. Roholtiella sp. LEGE 12411]
MESHLKTLVIIRGLPGSGKTATARAIAPNHNYAADDYGVYDADGNYLIDKQASAHEACFADTELAMKGGAQIIAVHNTFIEERFYIDYLILAAKYGYFSQVIDCEGGLYPNGSCSQNIHRVPEEIIENMLSRWQRYKPLIPVNELDYQVTAHAEWIEVEKSQLWEWVRAMARGDRNAVRADMKKDRQFWRVVNSYRYWEETNNRL